MNDVLNSLKPFLPQGASFYTRSLQTREEAIALMARINAERKFLCLETAPSQLFADFEGETVETPAGRLKICSLTHMNAEALRKWFSFTRPVPFGRSGMSLGLGDRLGLASPGHLRLLVKEKNIRPVLAQQSIRELTLTERTFTDVLDAASWSVFQEGYTFGFGADGDHLKTVAEVRGALDAGCSMITLDCSEQIDNSISVLSAEESESRYLALPAEARQKWENRYLGKCFRAGSLQVCFEEHDFRQIVLTYHKALGFMKEIFISLIQPHGGVDFEISIDETRTPTSPEAHYFVAQELVREGIEFTSLAPRFCGEFQKGIDYRGDLRQFEAELKVHAEIADHFGYRLSIHSGSDKFSVFPLIGRYTHGRVHVKTAGTNWLEAVRVVARKNPALYRSMHAYALEHFDEAKKYYHVSTDLDSIPRLQNLADAELPALMDHDDSRQLLHISYGLLLTAKDKAGVPLFRDDFLRTLNDAEEDYAQALVDHIGKHIRLLQGTTKDSQDWAGRDSAKIGLGGDENFKARVR